MADSPQDAAIVRSTVDLAHRLHLRVIAEGVETHAVWGLLADSRATRRSATSWRAQFGETLAAWLHTIGRQTMIGARDGRWLVNHL
jgi:diguanylate cyclase